MFCVSATVDDESGPGMMFMPFVVMEDLLDKLKLLNYEQEFVAELRMRPLNRFADISRNMVKLIICPVQALFCSSDQPWRTVLHVHVPVLLVDQEGRGPDGAAAGV